MAQIDTTHARPVLAGDGATLTITADTLRVVETLSGEVLLSVYVREVQYTSVGYSSKRKKEVFCFISADTRLGRMLCHVFDMAPGAPKRCCEVCVCV